MAKIDDLLDDVPDPKLRSELRQAVNEMRAARTFGLVFEDHIPEEVALPGLPVRKGSIVQNRTRPDDTTKHEVIEVDGDEAKIRPVANGGETTTVHMRDLMVVRRFGEPIYPGLTQVGEVRRGPDDQPAHAVINAENFHALQMLTYTHAGKVDVIYADPPYNTGDKSWKYNNRFVDANDQWRHSKWLSMMEKRLKLAKVLLKPDGVLIVTIDEHEVHHLGVLLEQLFPESRSQMVTIVINPAGVSQGTFGRVEEYAIFVFRGEANVAMREDDLLSQKPHRATRSVTWDSVLRRGTNALPSDRPNLVFPVGIDPHSGRITGTGPTLKERIDRGEVQVDPDSWEPDAGELVDGFPATWPIRSDGSLGNWRLGAESLMRLAEEGFARVGSYDPTRRIWPLSYLGSRDRKRIADGEIVVEGRDAQSGAVVVRHVESSGTRPKTVWNRPSHNSGTHGAALLRAFLGRRSFDYPKSLYAVADAISAVLDRADGVILDFFAGSGTTLHAVSMLNARDRGQRQVILVTNNDLSESDARRAMDAEAYSGDRSYEDLGIFSSVTMPRCEAAITGQQPNGSPVPGSYLPTYLERAHADGLDANVSFFRMDYLDPDVVSVGRQYAAIAPLLWLASGSVGRWVDRDGDEPWSAPESTNYAVLFDEDQFAEFKTLVERSKRVSYVWLVTNSSQGFAEMRAQLPEGLEVQMLYRDYLSNFRVNTADTFS